MNTDYEKLLSALNPTEQKQLFNAMEKVTQDQLKTQQEHLIELFSDNLSKLAIVAANIAIGVGIDRFKKLLDRLEKQTKNKGENE